MPRSSHKKRVHLEASRRPGQALCGHDADKLTSDREAVDCGSCRKIIGNHNALKGLIAAVGKRLRAEAF